MENKTAKVGIFFEAGNDFLIDAVQLDKGEPCGDAIGYSGHYDFHENLVPSTSPEHRFKAHAYDYYPRPRGLLSEEGLLYPLIPLFRLQKSYLE